MCKDQTAPLKVLVSIINLPLTKSPRIYINLRMYVYNTDMMTKEFLSGEGNYTRRRLPSNESLFFYGS